MRGEALAALPPPLQYPPGMDRRVTHSALILDEVRHRAAGPLA